MYEIFRDECKCENPNGIHTDVRHAINKCVNMEISCDVYELRLFRAECDNLLMICVRDKLNYELKNKLMEKIEQIDMCIEKCENVFFDDCKL